MESFHSRLIAFNRTKLELKHADVDRLITDAFRTFNRTILELKSAIKF